MARSGRLDVGEDRQALNGLPVISVSKLPGSGPVRTATLSGQKWKGGDRVEVLIGTDLVITGWVEATPVRYDARSISVGITAGN
jgi:hypothetical protein